MSDLRSAKSIIFFSVLSVMLLLAPLESAATDFEGQPVSLELQKAELHNVFLILAEVSGLNFVLHRDVVGTISMKLIEVPWDQVLDIVLRTKGLYHVQEGNVIIVVPLKDAAALYR